MSNYVQNNPNLNKNLAIANRPHGAAHRNPLYT